MAEPNQNIKEIDLDKVHDALENICEVGDKIAAAEESAFQRGQANFREEINMGFHNNAGLYTRHQIERFLKSVNGVVRLPEETQFIMDKAFSDVNK